jgi:hypothetical protein
MRSSILGNSLGTIVGGAGAPPRDASINCTSRASRCLATARVILPAGCDGAVGVQ